jgi:serine/threonine protein kinase
MTRLSLEAGQEPFPGYRLVRLRGRGGFAEVWEATAPNNDRVALKFMPTTNSNSASRELRSIQAVRRLSHPGLVQIYQVWSTPSNLVVSMELADGSLQDLHEAYHTEYGSLMPINEICHYLWQAAQALDFLNKCQHQEMGRTVGYQHCDVKPGNLLLFGERVKLADFGLTQSSNGLAQGTARAGTPCFAAPEIFRGKLYDRSDQFSLAVTYFYLRTGAMPFANEPTTFDPKYVHPEPRLDMLTEAERPIVRKALSPVNHCRWPSCSEFIQQLCQAHRNPQSETMPIGVV